MTTSHDPKPMHWLATCAKGLEHLLSEELRELGVESPKAGLASVSFDASLALAQRVALRMLCSKRRAAGMA